MKKLFTSIIALILGGFIAGAPLIASTPVFAEEEDNCVKTIFFGKQCGEEGIRTVLTTVIDIMSGLIVFVAVIGITICGIQYLTASGNEEQLKKSKRRIFEIVIGLAVYVVIYALLKFILPGFNGVK